MNFYKKIILIGLLCCSHLSYAEKSPPLIRLGVLAFGTVNWELEAMKQAGLITTADYRVQITKMANPQAGKIALQSGSVDMIVADWVWVSYQRSLGRDYSFYPYSNTTGALVVNKKSAIQTWRDLKGKKLAIAGGELDKNSLLLQAVMLQANEPHLFTEINKVYGAPPLLSHQLKVQRVDGLLTYWHYAAKLEAEGFKVLMRGADLLQQLGIKQQVPSIGYVFNREWANQHKTAIQAFLATTKQTKNNLCEQDNRWQGIETLIRAASAKSNQLLREKYCAGRIVNWGEAEQHAADDIYQIFKRLSNKRLTGNSEHLEQGTFW